MRNDVIARLPALVLTVLLCTSCAAQADKLAADVPRAAMPVAIDEVLKAGEDAYTRERVARILATPEMQRAIGDVAKTATGGALDAMSSDESKERIAALTNELTKAVAEGIRRDLAPAMVAGARDSLKTELAAGDRIELEGAVTSLAASGTKGALRSAADEIPTTLGPAVTQALVNELHDPALRSAVSGMVSETTRDALMGAQEALGGTKEKKDSEGKIGPFTQIRDALMFSWILAFALGVGAVAFLTWGLRLKRRTKRYRLALVSALAKKEEVAEGGPEEARMQRLVELLQ